MQSSRNETRLVESRIIHGDCLDVLQSFPDACIDLIVTSPPYADARKQTYGGIPPGQYIAWFVPIADQLFRVLKPDGSFVLNIKEKVTNGERHTYVIELILELRRRGWLWTEEYIWHKRNSFPGKWPNRFRDAWERCLHFTKRKQFKMYQEAVMVPVGEGTKKRVRQLSKTDYRRHESQTGSKLGCDLSGWINRPMVYPSNVIHIAPESQNQNHSAAYPKSLPSWFIKLFSCPGDVILDPFLGSGTTGSCLRGTRPHVHRNRDQS
jgi:site-specific DNA-methyltransferase (adenine-specific)